MRQHQPLAVQRQPQPVDPRRHVGSMVAARPNSMRHIEAAAGFTVRGGHASIIAMIDHNYGCYLRGQVARRSLRLDALEQESKSRRDQSGLTGR